MNGEVGGHGAPAAMGINDGEAGEVEGKGRLGFEIDESAFDFGGILGKPDEAVGVVSGEVGFDEVLGDGG